jgi:hypothetical protein
VELAYTRDLKSRTRNGFMGSSPIGATISSSLFGDRGGTRSSGAGHHRMVARQLAHCGWRRYAETEASLHVSSRSPSKFGAGRTHGAIAQLAEHRTFNPRVVGSIPTGPTILQIKERKRDDDIFAYACGL